MQSSLPSTLLVDPNGEYARFNLQDYEDETHRQIMIYPERGGQLLVSRDLLVRSGDFFKLKVELRDLASSGTLQEHEQVVVQVVEEEATFDKRLVQGDTVRVRKVVDTESVVVDEPLFMERVEVQRINLNTPVVAGEVPQARYEGDTLIIPVVKEVIVVEKRLVITEEVRITRQRVEVHTPQRVELRKEDVLVERHSPSRKQTSD